MPRRGRKQNKNKIKSSRSTNVPVPSNPAELESVLLQMLAPNNEAIMMATTILQNFLRTKICVVPLVQQISSSSNVGARQMAAVILRVRMAYLWGKLDNQVKGELQNILLQRLVQEGSRPVRLGVAALISEVAKVAVPKGQWNNLLDHLLELTRSQNTAHREVSMTLFRALAENIPKTLKPHFRTLLNIFQAGLVDQSEDVNDEALKAVGCVVELIRPTEEDTEQSILANIEMFRTVVPFLVQYAQKALRQENEDAVSICFGVLDDLANSPADVLRQQLPAILEMMIHAVLNVNYEMTLREKASSFIVQIVQGRPGIITKHNILQPLLEACLRIAIEPYTEVFEEGQTNPQNLAFEMLDAVIMAQPKRLVYPFLMENVNKLISSQDDHHRKGAYVVLAIMSEGCAEVILESGNLGAMVQGVCNGIRDPSPFVRAAACVCLSQFSDYLKPQITQFHELVVAGLLASIDNPSETNTVKQKSVVALEVTVESLGVDAKVYTQPIMQRMFALLQCNQQKLQCAAVATIKATALATPTAFKPFCEQILGMMATVMQNDTEEMLKLRCKATECVGAVAIAMGKQEFQQRYLEGFLPLAIKGMSLEEFELRESTYHFFAQLAMLLQDSFQPLLQTVITFCLTTCMSDDGIMKHGSEIGTAAPDWEYDDSGDEQDPLAELRAVNVSIRTGALEEKMAALNCIATIMDCVPGQHIIPYLPKTLEVLDQMSEYSHHIIRSTTTSCLAEVLRCVNKTFPSTPETGNPNYNQQAKPYVDEVVPLLILRLVEEDNKEVVATAAESLISAFNLFGVGAASDKIKYIYEGVLDIMEGKSYCQPEEQDIDEKEMADHDDVLLDEVTDLITALAKAVGPEFDVLYQKLFKPLVVYCAPERPAFDRSMSIGCFAEVNEFLGANLPKYIPHVVPIVLAGLQDQAVAVRRNSAFCAGTLIQYGKEHVTQFYGQFLERLNVIIQGEHKTDDLQFCRDNAVSAVAKLIMTAPNQIPMQQVVPLFLSGLPLEKDMLETKYAYSCLIGLCRSHAEMMSEYTPQILTILSQVLGSPVEDVSADIQVNLQNVAKALAQQLGNNLMPFIQTLPQENQQRLTAYLS